MGKIGSPNGKSTTITVSEFETLNCSVKSENRDNVLQYLFDILEFKPIQQITLFDKPEGKRKNQTIKRFHSNCLKLQFPLFKRLIQCLPISTKQKCSKNEFREAFQDLTSEYSKIIISNNIQQVDNKFNQLLNYLQVMIYSFSILKPNNSNYIGVLNKINHLINYYENPQSTTEEQYDTGNEQFAINYKQFDFIKEIKKIYIFQYMYKKSESSYNFSKESLLLKLDYYSQYQELKQCIIKLLKHKQAYRLPLDSTMIQQISIKHLDCNLIEFVLSLNIESFNHISSNLYNDSIIPFIYYHDQTTIIEKQIKFLPILSRFCNNKLMDVFLNNLFFKFKLSIDQIKLAISTFNTLNLKLNARYLIGDFSIFKYFHNDNKEHYEQIDWINESISISIISDGNLEFIEYINKHQIGSINSATSIKHCKNLKTAQFMYDHLNFTFDNSFINISNLDQYNSNYLIYYGLNKFMSSSSGTQFLNKSIELSFCIKILNDIKLMYFIVVKLLNNDHSLFNKIIVGYSPSTFSNYFYSIDQVTRNGNIKYISKYIDNVVNLTTTKQNGYENYKMSSTQLRKTYRDFDPLRIYTTKDKELYILYLLKQFNDK